MLRGFHGARGAPRGRPNLKALANAGGQTPLHACCGFACEPGIAARLLAAEADPQARSKIRWTPLEYAARMSTGGEVATELTAVFAAAGRRARAVDPARAPFRGGCGTFPDKDSLVLETVLDLGRSWDAGPEDSWPDEERRRSCEEVPALQVPCPFCCERACEVELLPADAESSRWRPTGGVTWNVRQLTRRFGHAEQEDSASSEAE